MSASTGKPVLAFDVFGTLVDPAGLVDALQPHVGEQAPAFAGEWRRMQVEYLIRHAAMSTHRPFPEVTGHALTDCLARFGLQVDATIHEQLVAAWSRLPALPDAANALERLTANGHRAVAFSNGRQADVTALLERAGLAGHLAAVHGVEVSGTYKPAPVVYHQLARDLAVAPEQVWLISANFWDAAGACSAGLRAAWLARGREPDTWPWRPDLIVDQLADLADHPALAQART